MCQIDKISGYTPRWGIKQSKANYKQNSDYSPPNNFWAKFLRIID